MGDLDKAKELFEQIPALLDKKKIGGKDLPTEVFIKKKRTFIALAPGLLAVFDDDWWFRCSGLLQRESKTSDGF